MEAITQETIEFVFLLGQKGWLGMVGPIIFEIVLHFHPRNDQKIHSGSLTARP